MEFKVSLFHFSATTIQIDGRREREQVGRGVNVNAHVSARSGGGMQALDTRATEGALAPRQFQNLPSADRQRCTFFDSLG
jgi:hypothetical protein